MKGVHAFVVAITFFGLSLCFDTQGGTNASPVAEGVGATATEVTQSIQDTGKSAVTGIEGLWKRIDERRLKNRTVDELVAWALMGLLVGGVLHRFTKLSKNWSVLVGLMGAFLGGIIANVLQLDLGFGPVLIRYEDLLCSLAGGGLLLFGWNWYRQRKASNA